jgi:hypothetical protein
MTLHWATQTIQGHPPTSGAQLHHICKVPLLRKVTYLQDRRLGHGLFFQPTIVVRVFANCDTKGRRVGGGGELVLPTAQHPTSPSPPAGHSHICRGDLRCSHSDELWPAA